MSHRRVNWNADGWFRPVGRARFAVLREVAAGFGTERGFAAVAGGQHIVPTAPLRKHTPRQARRPLILPQYNGGLASAHQKMASPWLAAKAGSVLPTAQLAGGASERT